MAATDELEFETPSDGDAEVVDVPAGKRSVYTESSDPEIDSLHKKFQRGKLVVQPEFQREFVWDVTRASRLVESALLGIPIPIVYISEEPDNKEYVSSSIGPAEKPSLKMLGSLTDTAIGPGLGRNDYLS
ncbi:DUF262 domain-containing protein [Reyranella sp.]|uniref:DUF262 domain-containing protein n=1 Tax=Reyranella sp. TaxID=1929291 RepID=UPI0027229398|nr:DUF262 domain-containing protein [Reyranella sp.]MDO8973130.1 DUF262 domain-containing protein [Reyranella sp.]